ncbi:hypothetical protein QFZ73_001689 [Peribacillus sp. V2I11]|nr:hypothetical protein [Peribacillus sp. V2I11]
MSLLNSTFQWFGHNILSRMELQACSVRNFLITSGICTFTREFWRFTREFLHFTREFSAFTREFLHFTREFSAFTREFLHFTREFRITPDIFSFHSSVFPKRKKDKACQLCPCSCFPCFLPISHFMMGDRKNKMNKILNK